jgi:4-amino-4-deoxy-L-arabinose transferase-like glycosyltransferase
VGNSPGSRSFRGFGLLFALTLAVRFPFFFPAVLAWDESTFILMGQSILDGHLPYVELWDLKPPLAFAFYSLAIALFGKDLVGIRLAGTLCVVATAVLVSLLTGKLWNRQSGLIAATLTIVAISLLPAGQATMTEHVVLVPLLGATYLLISRNESLGTLFLTGILMATATLVRLNIGYVAIVVGIYLLATSIRLPATALRRMAAYSAGGMLVVIMTWLPYLLAGQPQVWWTSVIAAPLSYSNAQDSTVQNLIRHGMHTLGVYEDGSGYKYNVAWFNVMVWCSAVAGVATVFWRWQRCSREERRGVLILTLLTVATGFSIVKSGAAHEHYMIQLVPFAAMFAAALVWQFPAYALWPSLLLAGVLLIGSIGPVLAEYRVLVSRALAHQGLRYGAAYEVAAYLKRENSLGRPVYLLTDHVAYWLTSSYPPTKLTTHPSNIAKPYLVQVVTGQNASTEDELQKVFQKAPEFVVMTDNVRYLREGPKMLLDNILADEYLPAAQIHGRKIYRVKQRP